MRQVYPKKKQRKPRRSRPLPRKFHINGEEWRWEHTGSTIKVLAPNDQYRTINPMDILKEIRSPEDLTEMTMTCECDDCKGIKSLGPREIKAYVEKHLLKEMMAA